MAIMKQHLSSAITFNKSTHLQSLAENKAIALGSVDMSTNDYPNAKIRLTVNLSTSTLDPGGRVVVYFLGSIDNTNWTDGMTATSTASQSTKLNTAQEVISINAGPDMTAEDITWICNDLSKIVGDLPPYWSLAIQNLSGQSFQASGHTATYYTATYKGTT